jgi:hypothetical protein
LVGRFNKEAPGTLLVCDSRESDGSVLTVVPQAGRTFLQDVKDR